MQGKDGGQGGAAQGCSWCCGRPPSDGAGNSHCSRPQDCPISGLRNLFRAKKCWDMDHSRSEVSFFKFWTLTETAWCINDNWCQWWSSLARNRQSVMEQHPRYCSPPLYTFHVVEIWKYLEARQCPSNNIIIKRINHLKPNRLECIKYQMVKLFQFLDFFLIQSFWYSTFNFASEPFKEIVPVDCRANL